jgi:8-hydroxy-5-deazaflavin:NADPH oxidoreductase
MRIAMIGTGSVGRALGVRFAGLGHQVAFGSRHPSSGDVEQLLAGIEGTVRAASPTDAVSDSELVVLAVPWSAAESVVRSLGELGERILVDCTNPLLPEAAGLDLRGGVSGAERVDGWARGGRVVKAFNTTGAGNMADADYGDRRLSMPLCGDDRRAKETVAGLARDIGFEPLDCGALSAAVMLEHLALLWIRLAYEQGLGPQVGFALLRREA